jgi:hypothetical protein
VSMWGVAVRLSYIQDAWCIKVKLAGAGVSSVDCWQPRCAASAVVMLDTPCSEVL